MKSILIPAILLAMPMAINAAQGIEIQKSDGETLQIANTDLTSVTFDGNDALLNIATGEIVRIDRSLIGDLKHVDEVAAQLTVTFDGDKATVINPYLAKGVTTEISGAYVTVNNTNTAEELSFTLTGKTDDGGFLYNGSFKCTLNLAGVEIRSLEGAAVDIACSKRIAVNVIGDNVLTDASSGSHKACLYFKGHPEITGKGTLTVTGNTGHAISSKEYIQLKKSFGTLNILGAEKDGIHAGQYFQMNGGKVTIRNAKSDGIQAEATSKATDENNGRIIIKDGTLDILCSADDGDCIKSDSLLTISGGKFILASSGATAKGIKSNGCLTITGGTFDITMSGNGVTVATTTNAPAMRAPGGGRPGGGGPGGWPGGWDKEDVETSAPGCIKADSILTISGGTFNLRATGKGGKCINCDNDAYFGAAGTEGPSITAATSGAPVIGSGENINGLPKAIKVYGNLIIDSGTYMVTTKQNGGEGIECKSHLTINGGLISCQTYDDGINAGSKITINDGFVFSSASNNDGMDCNGSEGFEFNGGIILASGSTTPEEGFDCDNYKFVINGGTIIGTGGATSSVTKATQPYVQTSGQSITANQYLSLQKADGTVICSYKVPKSLSATIVVSSPEFVSGTSYRLVRNSTAVNNPTASYLDGRFTIGGTLTSGTTTNITPKTK